MDAPFYGQQTGNLEKGKDNWTDNKAYSIRTLLGFLEEFC
jgi:hypothetical protein